MGALNVSHNATTRTIVHCIEENLSAGGQVGRRATSAEKLQYSYDYAQDGVKYYCLSRR